MNIIDFIKKVEGLTNPKDIALLQTISPWVKIIPNKLQNKIFAKSSKKNPFIGFVVEPYSTFICYKIKNLEAVKQLLPDGFELVKTRMFENSLPEYWVVLGCFNVHSSAFSGTRVEFNVIAKNLESQLISWVIIDYETNALSYDKYNGLVSCTTNQAVLTTDFLGNIIIDIKNNKKGRELSTIFNMDKSEKERLGEKIWLDGNWSVAYGKIISKNSSEAFSLRFDPQETEYGYRMSTEAVKVKNVGWFEDLIEEEPSEIIYFPYAQHYLSDSPGNYSKITSKKDMLEQLNSLDNIPPYSVKPIKKIFLVMLFINSLFLAWLFFILLK